MKCLASEKMWGSTRYSIVLELFRVMNDIPDTYDQSIDYEPLLGTECFKPKTQISLTHIHKDVI